MTPAELFDDFKSGFGPRKFSAGLLVAFIDLYLSLDVPALRPDGFAGLLSIYPRQLKTKSGKHANTLILQKAEGVTVSLRPFYNKAEKYYRAEKRRFDYPSCAPHATQAWTDYVRWLDALTSFDEEQLFDLQRRINEFVLDELADQTVDPATVVVEVPTFRRLLQDFDLTPKSNEPSGAAFQGVVFGFLRADNPHLQVEIDKVRTGSKRLQRVGDIDAWEGGRLAVTAEVKQYVVSKGGLSSFEAFAHEVRKRGALGIVAALGFEEGVRDALESSGVRALDKGDIVRIVELWDPLKQRTAVSSFVYYAKHVEKNSTLSARLSSFLASLDSP